MKAQHKLIIGLFLGILITTLTSCKARSTKAPLPAKTEPVGLAQPAPTEDVPGTWVQKTLQDKVVAEAKAKGLEAFGLFSKGGWQGDDSQYIVTIDRAAGTADLHYYAPLQKNAVIHKVSNENLATLRATAEPFDKQDDYNPTVVIDGFHYNYMHFIPGLPIARLYMNAPGATGNTEGYIKLLQVFKALPRK
jgi:hypothetical protein